MINYVIWKSESEYEFYVEILNDEDIRDIQKEFLKKGYIIWKCHYMDDHCWMYVIKKGEEDGE